MRARGPARLIGVFVVLLLGACAAPEPAPVFVAPSYSYLKPLRLNVGTIEIAEDWVPGPADVGALSPVPPIAALERMARDRLAAADGQGRAVFRIEDAAILRTGDMLSGDFVVRLDILRANGSRAGYAEARVTQAAVLPDEAQLRRTLYLMVSRMMADMNVELEYQVRRTLGRWLVSGATPGSALPAPVHRQALPPPELPAAGF